MPGITWSAFLLASFRLTHIVPLPACVWCYLALRGSANRCSRPSVSSRSPPKQAVNSAPKRKMSDVRE